ncbi:hypothetical protein PAAG_11031 [Paracoccidioides lutzii Pb01]|uniref:Uncharacterized protein n=1 Tax=Paracoccidioides lutzii (strain ATCC MYA-826 / Pb01) TaxID=502779 RepID=A0A0A2V6X4_PARBA|nr:hypothetical protein PAAG_11031 [Paracoccidioides lutzii Pb01]KGQ02082.1 hypothetical protein PAAG_11031 [Paracoccidioides lutzii Pb01]
MEEFPSVPQPEASTAIVGQDKHGREENLEQNIYGEGNVYQACPQPDALQDNSPQIKQGASRPKPTIETASSNYSQKKHTNIRTRESEYYSAPSDVRIELVRSHRREEAELSEWLRPERSLSMRDPKPGRTVAGGNVCVHCQNGLYFDGLGVSI